MLIQELVVIATLLIVGGAIVSIVWRVMTAGTADKKLDALVAATKSEREKNGDKKSAK